MTGFWPLIIEAGQQEQLGPDRRAEIQRLNLGPFEPVINPTNGFTISSSVVAIFGNANNIVDTVLGGEQGDMLILICVGRVRLRNSTAQDGLRIQSNYNMNAFDTIWFYHGGLTWVELGRN